MKEIYEKLIDSIKYYLLGPRFRVIFFDIIGIGLLFLIIYFIYSGKIDFYNIFDLIAN